MRALVAGLCFAGVGASTAPAWAAPPKTKKSAPKADNKKKKAPAKAKKPGPQAAPAAAAPAPAEVAPIKLELPIERASLDNGLRVVLNVDHTSPTVAVAVSYDVGGRNEEKGRSGFAHLFEHMMFQGSANVAKGEHFKLVQGHGGSLNGTTGSDRTNYFEVLPSNELALGLWLEADRMKSLDISESNFENQRKVVQEEYRMRVSNSPYAPSNIRLEELVYQGYWPYEHPVIGSMPDLDAAKLDWVRDFFAHHYGPNNAVLAISGDFEPAEAMAMVHKYFDAIPKIAVTPYAEEPLPEQTSQRTAVVQDQNARSPGLLLGWAIPPARSPDHYALDLATTLLAGGESSRLHQSLVRDKATLQSVHAYTHDRRGPDELVISCKLSDKGKLSEVEQQIEAEIKALATRGPSDAEVAKARRQTESSLVFGVQANLSRARQLADYELLFGDARHLNAELPLYLAVTKDDIKRVVAKYLGPTRRTIVETNPAEGAEKPAPKAEPPAHHATAKAKAPAAPAKKGAAAPAKPKKKK